MAPCFQNRPLFGNFKVPSENLALGKDRKVDTFFQLKITCLALIGSKMCKLYANSDVKH